MLILILINAQELLNEVMHEHTYIGYLYIINALINCK